MYSKIFRQIFNSSIAEKPEVRFTFIDLLTLADGTGRVNMTHEAIARVTNRPLEVIKSSIQDLESPDPKSQTRDHEGCRIVRLDAHRDWGWQIVNFLKYRFIGSEEERREYKREWMAKVRKHNPSYGRDEQVVDTGGQCGHKQKQKKKEKKKYIYNTADLESAERVYQAYPRKVGKPNAIRAILRCLTSTTPADLLAKTDAYAKSRVGQDPNFTPHPATWFNQHRYNDDPATWAKQPDKPKQKFRLV